MRRFPAQEFPVAEGADEGAVAHGYLASDGDVGGAALELVAFEAE